MSWLGITHAGPDEDNNPADQVWDAHWHVDDAEDRGVCDVVPNTAAIPASLAELRSWYGVRAVTIKGPCYGGERCF